MKSSRFLFFVMISLGFAFLITQQRMESRQYDIQISQLNKDIENINSQKRDIHFQIQQQKQRLTLNSTQDVGLPISMNDIVPVQLEESPGMLALAPTNNSPVDQVLTKLFIWSRQNKLQ